VAGHYRSRACQSDARESFLASLDVLSAHAHMTHTLEGPLATRKAENPHTLGGRAGPYGPGWRGPGNRVPGFSCAARIAERSGEIACRSLGAAGVQITPRLALICNVTRAKSLEN